MKDSTIIKIPSHPKYLSVVRSVTAVMCELHGLTVSEVENIKLAVDEACSNVIKYAYCGYTDQSIDVKFKVTKRKLEVIIEDTGKKHPPIIEGRKLEDVKPGGLGMHLIRRAFDTFAFDERKKKGNRFRLIRKISKKKGKNED
jgi:anti-sigma regulatory factor (Ser/Thr protein kinase)